jgi:hypothetical protein
VSLELLQTIPKLRSFQDLLAMEYRRTMAASQNLSLLVATVQPMQAPCSASSNLGILADAAKAIVRKLRRQDSIYLLCGSTFGIVLPGVSKGVAQAFSARVTEGLCDAAGANSRFSCKIHVVSCPEDASSTHHLQEAVYALLPADNSSCVLADEAPI